MIYRAKLDDFSFILDCSRRLVAESSYAYATVCPEKIFDLLMSDSIAFFIATTKVDGKEDGKEEPIGFIGVACQEFFFSKEKMVNDLGFFIAPKYRGGTAAVRLLAAAKKWAKSMGVKQFFIGQTVSNKVDATRNFYERQGFSICGVNAILNLKEDI